MWFPADTREPSLKNELICGQHKHGPLRGIGQHEQFALSTLVCFLELARMIHARLETVRLSCIYSSTLTQALVYTGLVMRVFSDESSLG